MRSERADEVPLSPNAGRWVQDILHTISISTVFITFGGTGLTNIDQSVAGLRGGGLRASSG